MDADLVRPPRLQPEPQERRVLLRLDGFEVRDGVLAAFLGHDGHLPPVARVAAEERLDGAIRRVGHAPHEREVAAADRSVHELLGEVRVRDVVLRHDHQPRRVFVEAVHDAGPHGHVAVVARRGRRGREADVFVLGLLVFLLEREQPAADVVQERVDERARPVAVGRVHDEVGLLVDDEEDVVLVHDVERDRLGPGLDGRRALEHGTRCGRRRRRAWRPSSAPRR